MRLVSFDDTEAGVLAIGTMPVGIIAIGGMPVGVVAIGICAAGGVAVTSGVAVGLVAISCGVSAGGYSAGVGLGVGLKTAIVGLALDVVATVERVLDLPPAPSRFDRRVSDDAVALERLTDGELSAGWVLLEAKRSPGQAWVLFANGAPIELAGGKLARALKRLTKTDRRVLAHLVAEERPDPSAASSDYRSALPTKRVLRCDELVTDGKEPGPTETHTVSSVDAWGALWKAPLLLAVLALALWGVHERVADLELDRKGEVSFAARVVSATGEATGIEPVCAVRAWLRTDGGTRRKAAVEVSCGETVLYARTRDQLAGVGEVPAAAGAGAFRYRLHYLDEGMKPDDDSSGRPRLELDTGAHRAVIESWDDPAYRVELTVDELSAERSGAPLVVADGTR